MVDTGVNTAIVMRFSHTQGDTRLGLPREMLIKLYSLLLRVVPSIATVSKDGFRAAAALAAQLQSAALLQLEHTRRKPHA